MTNDSIRDGALALPDSERAELAADLLASLGPEPEEDEEAVRQAWAAEFERRAARLDSGEDIAIPLDEALGQVRTNLAT